MKSTRSLSFIISILSLSTLTTTGFSTHHQQRHSKIKQSLIKHHHKNDGNECYSIDRGSFIKKAFTTALAIPLISSILISSPQPTSAAPNSKDIPQLGTKAPYFSLPSTLDKGVEINLNQLTNRDKWTVLYFYPGAFTSGCTLEARGFQRDMNEYNNLNTQIVGVSVDPVEKNSQFCTEEKLDYALLTDEGGKVSKAYGTALSIPGFGTFSNRQTYLIDPNGTVQFVFTDVEGRVARHSTEVLEKLKELQT